MDCREQRVLRRRHARLADMALIKLRHKPRRLTDGEAVAVEVGQILGSHACDYICAYALCQDEGNRRAWDRPSTTPWDTPRHRLRPTERCARRHADANSPPPESAHLVRR